jgi:hypothetical protein
MASQIEIFVGASEFKDVAGLAAIASAGAGLFAQTLAAAQAGTFYANLTAFLRTIGLFPIAGVGVPPLTTAQLATVSGNPITTTGMAGQGLEIDSVDVIYTNTVANLAVATIGITKTKFADSVAPVVTNLLALGANGLPVAFQVTPHVKNIALANPAPIADTQTDIIANVNLTAGAGSAVTFYGINLHCSIRNS